MYFHNIRRILFVVTLSNTKSNWRKAQFPIGKAQEE